MSLLRNSLFELYRNDPYVLELLLQCDLSILENNFTRELYARLDKESCEEAQEILSSDLVNNYDYAVQSATLAITKDIAQLLDLVLTENTGRLN